MALAKYKQKRNFKNTPEPGAAKGKRGRHLTFVVQRHHASHLHYDFRLEMEGVLKSWAVPKGPSMNPGDKRLAMMVEDHPFAYRKFAGTIPEGNYGAGQVEIWDEGTYDALMDGQSVKEDEQELLKELKKGDLKIVLHGKHLKGAFALVKMKGRPDVKKDNAWLLIKKEDDYAVHKNYTSENYTPVKRAKKNATWQSNRDQTVKKAPAKKAAKEATAKKAGKKKARAADEEEAVNGAVVQRRHYEPGLRTHVPNYIKPMLARLADNAFDNDEWLFEIKWDGYRAIAETGKQLKFYSRNGLSFMERFPEIADQLEKIKAQLVLDGEVVAIDEKGVTSFQLLQNYQNQEASIAYYVFDILKKGGKDLTDLPLTERKKILKQTLKTNAFLRYSDDIKGEGKKFFALSKKKNLEGIMAKRADSTYSTGQRTDNWLKIKNHQAQETIIAGYTQPRNARKYFGALVLGVYEKGTLKYVGHTGTGFDESGLKELHTQLAKLKQKQSPFTETIRTNAPVTWVKPVLVAEVKYSEITTDGIMRHPVFLRLREDKKPKEVVSETKNEIHMAEKKSPAKKSPSKKSSAKKATGKKAAKKAPAKNPARKADRPAKTRAKKTNKEEEANEGENFGGQKVKLTNQTKVYFPKDKITKGDILNYYQSIASYILPYLKDRPQSLYRNPNGIGGFGFFQKDMTDEPDWIKTEEIYSESGNKEVNYLICNDRATLAYMNNLGCIELNPWHSRLGSLDNPDYIAIDLDPSPKNTFQQVIETAQAVKQVFDRGGVKSYCKTSGSTGLHIYVPLNARYTYDQVRDFVNLIALKANELVPDYTSLVRPLKQRGNNIYIDYLQNRRGQTLASVYSVRPKPGATVSTPLDWKEVKKGLDMHDFTIKNTLARLKKKGDLFKPVLGKGIDLMKCLKKLEK